MQMTLKIAIELLSWVLEHGPAIEAEAEHLWSLVKSIKAGQAPTQAQLDAAALVANQRATKAQTP